MEIIKRVEQKREKKRRREKKNKGMEQKNSAARTFRFNVFVLMFLMFLV